MVTDGVNGIFVPPRDPKALFDVVEELDKDRTKLAEIARSAELHVREHYSVELLARNFSALYSSLMHQVDE